MGSLLNRYRNLTFLLLVLLAQLILVAYQVRTGEDVRLLRVWAVSAVTPMARLLDSSQRQRLRLRQATTSSFGGVRQENRRLAAELDRLKMENRSCAPSWRPRTAPRRSALSRRARRRARSPRA